LIKPPALHALELERGPWIARLATALCACEGVEESPGRRTLQYDLPDRTCLSNPLWVGTPGEEDHAADATFRAQATRQLYAVTITQLDVEHAGVELELEIERPLGREDGPGHIAFEPQHASQGPEHAVVVFDKQEIPDFQFTPDSP